jgi:hypothetical protein
MLTLYLLVFISMAFAQVQPKLPTKEEMKMIEKDYQNVFQQALSLENRSRIQGGISYQELRNLGI